MKINEINMTTKRIEVRFNKTQEAQFLKDINNVSFMKNEYLAYNEMLYEQYRLGNSEVKYVTAYDFMKLFNNEILKYNPRLKFVKETNNKALQKATQQKEQAFLKHFKKTGGFPQFIKKRDRIKQGIFLMHGDTKYQWKREYGKVKVPSYGWVKLKEKDYLLDSDHINSCTIKKHGDRYYISFSIDNGKERQQPIKLTNKTLPPNSSRVARGGDLGIKVYLTDSDGNRYFYPSKKVNEINKKMKRLDKKRSRSILQNKNNKQWEKKNLEKINIKSRTLNWKKTQVIEGFIQNVVNSFVKCENQVCIEDLNIHGMIRNKHLSKLIQDRAFYKFKRKLIDKCSKIGKTLYLADIFFPSSKRCSRCGSLKEDLKLRDRVYRCSCGLELDRDYNAAINLSMLPSGLTGI